MTFAEMHVKWSLILADRLGPEILTMLEIKGQVLYCVRVLMKLLGWLSDLRRLTIVFRFSSTLTFDGFKKAK